MNVFMWSMANYEESKTVQLVLIDHLFVIVERRGTDQPYQSVHEKDSVTLARKSALETTEQLERMGWMKSGPVRAIDLEVVHDAVVVECQYAHTVGPNLSRIMDLVGMSRFAA